MLFDWNGDGTADHTAIATGCRDGALLTIGGNSGPGNIDGFTGVGGADRHSWPAPAGQSNTEVLVVVDASRVVHFGGLAHPTMPAKPLPAEPRLLMLKSPMMKGSDVRVVQQALSQRNDAGLATDGVYGPSTRDAVLDWQQRARIHTWTASSARRPGRHWACRHEQPTHQWFSRAWQSTTAFVDGAPAARLPAEG